MSMALRMACFFVLFVAVRLSAIPPPLEYDAGHMGLSLGRGIQEIMVELKPQWVTLVAAGFNKVRSEDTGAIQYVCLKWTPDPSRRKYFYSLANNDSSVINILRDGSYRISLSLLSYPLPLTLELNGEATAYAWSSMNNMYAVLALKRKDTLRIVVKNDGQMMHESFDASYTDAPNNGVMTLERIPFSGPENQPL